MQVTRGRSCAAGASIFNCCDDVGSAAAGREADHYIFARRAPARNIPLAKVRRIFIDLDGCSQCLGAAGHDVLNCLWRRRETGRTLGRIECGDTAARAGAHINQAAAVAQAAGNHVNDEGYLGQRFLHRSGNLRVLVVNDSGDVESGFRVETHRSIIGAFCR